MPRTDIRPPPPASGQTPADMTPALATVLVFTVSAIVGFIAGAGSAPAGGGGALAAVALLSLAIGGIAMLGAARWRRVDVDAALRDPTTGLYHRVCMDQLVPRLAARDDRADHSQITLVLLRIDLFDRLGSRYGRAFTDQALSLVGQKVRSQAREGDVPARFDLQTLAVFLQCEETAQAVAFGRRLATLLETEQIEVQGDVVKVSVSMGIAVRAPGEPLEELYRRAGDRLAQAADGASGQILA